MGAATSPDPWTPARDALLRAQWGQQTARAIMADLAALPGPALASVDGVRKRAHKLGLSGTQQYLTADDHRAIATMLRAGATIQQAAEAAGRRKGGLEWHLSKYGGREGYIAAHLDEPKPATPQQPKQPKPAPEIELCSWAKRLMQMDRRLTPREAVVLAARERARFERKGVR